MIGKIENHEHFDDIICINMASGYEELKEIVVDVVNQIYHEHNESKKKYQRKIIKLVKQANQKSKM